MKRGISDLCREFQLMSIMLHFLASYYWFMDDLRYSCTVLMMIIVLMVTVIVVIMILQRMKSAKLKLRC